MSNEEVDIGIEISEEDKLEIERINAQLEKNALKSSDKDKKNKKKKKKKKKSKKKKESNESEKTEVEETEVEEKFNVKDTLTPQEVEIMDKMRELIKPEIKTPYEEKWVSDMCLVRYLRARDWDLKKATDLLKGTLEWRREYKPHLIKAEDVEIELKNDGKMYRNGKDKKGRPILYMKPGKDNTGVPEKDVKVKYLVYLMEKASLAADESKGVDKFVWCIDFKDHNQLAGMSMMKISKECLDILQNHYPERLGTAYMINAPWVFGIFFKFLSPFLTDTTKNKLKMVKNMSVLHEGIDLDQLEKDYGGTNDFKYSFDKHWQKEDKEFPPSENV